MNTALKFLFPPIIEENHNQFEGEIYKCNTPKLQNYILSQLSFKSLINFALFHNESLFL